MKKSTFKKAGVAVLSMAMLLSMGAATLSVSAAAPTVTYSVGVTDPTDAGFTGESHTIALPASTNGYTIYQVASAEKQNGIYNYTINAGNGGTGGFTNQLEVLASQIVTTKEIKNPFSGGTTVIPAGTDLDTIVSHSEQAQILANALKRQATMTGTPVGSYAETTGGDAFNLTVEPGYYLILTNTADESEPILVDVQATDATVSAIKKASSGIDKQISAIAAAHNDVDADTYIDTGDHDTALAPAGSTITYTIDTKLPAYHFSAPTIPAESTEMTLVQNMDPMVIEDTGSDTLTFKYDVLTNDSNAFDGIKVYVATNAGTPIDLDDNTTYVVATNVGASPDYSISRTTAHDFTIQFVNLFVATNGNKDVKIVYDAVLSETPNVNEVPNENDVTLSYSNNYDLGVGSWKDNGDPDPENPVEEEDKTDIYCTTYTANKLDENSKPLAGAEFELQMKETTSTTMYTPLNATVAGQYGLTDGTAYTWAEVEAAATTAGVTANTADFTTSTSTSDNWITVRTVNASNAGETQVDADGVALADQTQTGASTVKNIYTFTGLIPGDYRLHESVVPSGYQQADDYEFTITNDEIVGTKIYEGTFTFTDKDGQSITATIDVNNYKGQTLPGTGGIGTYLFTFGGAAVILMAGAMFVMYMKKREVEE